MKNNSFIRLNVNDNYLSLGNLFRIIKEESEITNAFLQSDIFCIIFNTYELADSTVNNYCTGFRAINSKYKEYIRSIKDKYEKNKEILIETFSKLLGLMENNSIGFNTITFKQINENIRLKHVCNRLYTISKNDSDVSIYLSKKLYQNLEENNLYDFIAQVLFYVVLEKKQPIKINEKLNDIIEKNIYDTNISVNSIQEFVKIQLNSGIWSIRGIKELAIQGNPFACFEMASMECYGIITGKPRYNLAYKYYEVAAQNNHPVANWAIGYLYYNGYIGSKNKRDLYLAIKYFNKAKRLNCSNAYNSLGLIALNENFPHINKNIKRATQMFEKAISLGNIYAYNNLGKIYEEQKDYKKAFENYIIAADHGESWAQNKVADFYRKGIVKNKDLKQAFKYYNLSSESSRFTLCKWSKYNLAKFFYEEGNLEIEVDKDIGKAIELLEDIADDLAEAVEELIFIYYKLYLESNKENKLYFEKLNFYIQKYEKSPNYNPKAKIKVEKKLKQLYNEHIQVPL